MAGIGKDDAQADYNLYRSFFRPYGAESTDPGPLYILLKGLDLRDQTANLGRYLLEDFAHYVSARKPHDERVLFIIDEFPAIAFGGANAATLFEMVRFRGAGVVVTAQSYAGMGANADRILGAAAGLVIHQCADPERLLPRAGQSVSFQRRVGFAERGMGAGVREYAVGEGTISASEELKMHADLVKRLQPGECFVIAGGAAQQVRVSRLLPGKSAQPRASKGSEQPQPVGDGPPMIEEIEAAERRAWRLPGRGGPKVEADAAGRDLGDEEVQGAACVKGSAGPQEASSGAAVELPAVPHDKAGRRPPLQNGSEIVEY